MFKIGYICMRAPRVASASAADYSELKQILVVRQLANCSKSKQCFGPLAK